MNLSVSILQALTIPIIAGLLTLFADAVWVTRTHRIALFVFYCAIAYVYTVVENSLAAVR